LLPKSESKPAGLVDERGCRRDIRSNGRIDYFGGARSDGNRFGRRTSFFIGADPTIRNFAGALCRSRFAPDVFADALVPSRRAVIRRGDSQISFQLLAIFCTGTPAGTG
jgi:hypothetical protein